MSDDLSTNGILTLLYLSVDVVHGYEIGHGNNSVLGRRINQRDVEDTTKLNII